MVRYPDVVAHNEELKNLPDRTAVFVGATQGIGLNTLKAFAKHSKSPTAYVVGRKAETLESVLDQLKTLNSSGTYIPVQCADLTLLRNVDQACASILKTEPPSKIDLLCISAGFMTFSGRHETAEGLDAQISIQFYSRMRFVYNLLPLLRKASAPRILSVLSGGKEGQVWPDDFPMKSHYSIGNVAGATGTFNTLFMEQLAAKPENGHMSFVHTLPGFVGDTNIFNKPEHFGPIIRFLLSKVVSPAVALFIGISSQEAGERTLYALTDDAFCRDGPNLAIGSTGEIGTGVYLVNESSNAVAGPKILTEMRKEGMGTKVWDHTMEEFERIGFQESL